VVVDLTCPDADVLRLGGLCVPFRWSLCSGEPVGDIRPPFECKQDRAQRMPSIGRSNLDGPPARPKNLLPLLPQETSGSPTLAFQMFHRSKIRSGSFQVCGRKGAVNFAHEARERQEQWPSRHLIAFPVHAVRRGGVDLAGGMTLVAAVEHLTGLRVRETRRVRAKATEDYRTFGSDSFYFLGGRLLSSRVSNI